MAVCSPSDRYVSAERVWKTFVVTDAKPLVSFLPKQCQYGTHMVLAEPAEASLPSKSGNIGLLDVHQPDHDRLI